MDEQSPDTGVPTVDQDTRMQPPKERPEWVVIVAWYTLVVAVAIFVCVLFLTILLGG